MKISITPQAFEVINSIADFVESKNTYGSGERFALRFMNAIERLGSPNVKYALCSHYVLAALNYSCSFFNDWVIAFQINNDELVVYEIIHGSLLF